ncbi:MAG: hypothetical protein ACLQU2_09195 [Candidatus Binataceae bacterium]
MNIGRGKVQAARPGREIVDYPHIRAGDSRDGDGWDIEQRIFQICEGMQHRQHDERNFDQDDHKQQNPGNPKKAASVPLGVQRLEVDHDGIKAGSLFAAAEHFEIGKPGILVEAIHDILALRFPTNDNVGQEWRHHRANSDEN